jgi:uncharacterized protein YdiU (UPF0061 family)
MDLFANRQPIQTWLYAFESMHKALGLPHVSERMLRANPKYVLRNHIAEQAIAAAKEKDFSVLQQLQHVLATPFDEHPEHQAWADFPPDWAAGIQISCSS